MTIRIPNNVRSAGANAMVDLLDAGAGAGQIVVRTGAQPATANDAATGTILATFTLNDPAFGVAANGVKTLDVDPVITATGVAAGTAGWARAVDSAGATVFDGSVSASGGGGDFIMSTTTVSVGLEITLTAGSMTQPGG